MLTPILAAVLAFGASPIAQVTTPAPTSPATPAAQDPAVANLTDKERSTLTRCNRMTEQERAQSSKCSEVMIKAGKADPAQQRPATPNVVPG